MRWNEKLTVRIKINSSLFLALGQVGPFSKLSQPEWSWQALFLKYIKSAYTLLMKPPAHDMPYIRTQLMKPSACEALVYEDSLHTKHMKLFKHQDIGYDWSPSKQLQKETHHCKVLLLRMYWICDFTRFRILSDFKLFHILKYNISLIIIFIYLYCRRKKKQAPPSWTSHILQAPPSWTSHILQAPPSWTSHILQAPPSWTSQILSNQTCQVIHQKSGHLFNHHLVCQCHYNNSAHYCQAFKSDYLWEHEASSLLWHVQFENNFQIGFHLPPVETSKNKISNIDFHWTNNNDNKSLHPTVWIVDREVLNQSYAGNENILQGTSRALVRLNFNQMHFLILFLEWSCTLEWSEKFFFLIFKS